MHYWIIFPLSLSILGLCCTHGDARVCHMVNKLSRDGTMTWKLQGGKRHQCDFIYPGGVSLMPKGDGGDARGSFETTDEISPHPTTRQAKAAHGSSTRPTVSSAAVTTGFSEAYVQTTSTVNGTDSSTAPVQTTEASTASRTTSTVQTTSTENVSSTTSVKPTSADASTASARTTPTEPGSTVKPVRTTSADNDASTTSVQTTSVGSGPTATSVQTTSADIDASTASVQTTPTGLGSTARSVQTTSADIDASTTSVQTTSAGFSTTFVQTTSADDSTTSVETTPSNINDSTTSIETTPASIECEGPVGDWWQYGDNCYFKDLDHKSWDAASASCQAFDGELAWFDSGPELRNITGRLTNNHEYWTAYRVLFTGDILVNQVPNAILSSDPLYQTLTDAAATLESSGWVAIDSKQDTRIVQTVTSLPYICKVEYG